MRRRLLGATKLRTPRGLIRAFLSDNVHRRSQLSDAILKQLQRLNRTSVMLFRFLAPLIVSFLCLTYNQFRVLSVKCVKHVVYLGKVVQMSYKMTPYIESVARGTTFSFDSKGV